MVGWCVTRRRRHTILSLSLHAVKTIKGPEFVTGTSPRHLLVLHLPNFILAALMYTLLAARCLHDRRTDSSNYIWRFFCRITDPVVAAVAW